MADDPLGEGVTVDVVDDRIDEDAPDSDSGGPQYRDADWLYQQYVVLERSIREIADHCDVWPKTIHRWLRRHDIETRPLGRGTEARTDALWRDEEWLREQYAEREKSAAEIAAERDCDERTIWNWLDHFGIGGRDYSDRHPAMREGRRYHDGDWLRFQYVELGKSSDRIADECDAAQQTILNWLDRHDIPKRTAAESRRLTEARPADVGEEDAPDEPRGDERVERRVGTRSYQGRASGLDLSDRHISERDDDRPESPYRNEGWLREQYEKHGSATPIAERCNVDPRTIYYWMDMFAIDRHD